LLLLLLLNPKIRETIWIAVEKWRFVFQKELKIETEKNKIK
jgi:hypothetical protein